MKCYLIVDYIHWRGGLWNVQRARIMPVGQVPMSVKIFTSQVDKAEKRARLWGKKNGIGSFKGLTT